ncbi:MAG: hypothetical protein BWY09_00206 [Candidatus Hydrogenedentes bacterium ADurb.Bin179]|nr:MAG: hypothetical protein BWY09_00206 [Candidatus Hydrogenedentes bacterium ADurb.Bin179]
MKKEFLSRIEFELEHRFYYLNYPEPVSAGYWKDGNGKFVPIDSMGLDHLKASINLLKKDRKAFAKAYAGALNEKEVVGALMPLLDAKIEELAAMLKKKAS